MDMIWNILRNTLKRFIMSSTLPKLDDYHKMDYSSGLIEWESGGFDDIPTSLLVKYYVSLTHELHKRGHNNDWILRLNK